MIILRIAPCFRGLCGLCDQSDMELKQFAEKLQKQLDNAQKIIDFDKGVYSDFYTDEAIEIVQKLAEYMPDINEENANDYRIQSMLNIAYDKGFEDCILMVCRFLDRIGVFSDEASFS